MTSFRRASMTAAALLALAPLVPLTAVPASASPAAGECVEPVPVRTYEPGGMSYQLEIDLGGCEWWDGGDIQLEAYLDRFDGTQGEGVGTAAICGTFFTDETPTRWSGR